MSVRSVRLIDGDGKRQSRGEWRTEAPANPYRHEDAMGLMLGRDAAAIALSIGLAPRTVRQWRERYDSEHRGPGVVLALAIRRALELGRPKGEALAVIDAILEENGETRCSRLSVERPTAVDISEHAVRTGKEAADACLAAVEAAKGGDRERFRREVREAHAALHELEQLVWTERAGQ